MTRPRIGVTVSRRSGWRVFPLFALNIWLAGGRAVRWQNPNKVDIESVKGVIIGGGDDISPSLYGGEIVAEAFFDDTRDALELDVIKQAFDCNIPILGVCRGSQMLNIALGGTLHQDAYGVFSSRRYKTILPRKTVTVSDETRLSQIAGNDPMKVNALHSQAVDTLGDGLRVAARDEGGMIQAIERITDPFALGVQWHPEHIFYARRQRRIFKALVAAATALMENENQIKAVKEDAISSA
ncbi:gamma-glutamyl-gamma-aminobutyrate hydrolase family protein [Parasulfitobacter algicola]|uniref:Gamma-glutamyl-gamma-aminobutyrate hydrolase family protein n=1 Tax=Parasulfitobacter algicola TaxID=2614809 RepID=A0ABX2ISD7_9RHOB|nr:gamma-glutamyl-gamma-aminobutyrate hydrolase family protein [Sulfitobacter algicola]NSX53995.1 gamma-glutamyl-gamma-aminobutyrate hydrolase family protein [Sulfitobacter algicola]